MEFLELTEQEFTAFARGTEQISYLQTPEMKAFREQRGAKGYYLGLKSDGVLLLASLVFSVSVHFGQKFEVNGGPLGDLDNASTLAAFLTGLKSFAAARSALYIEFEPEATYRTLDSQGRPRTAQQPDLIENFKAAGAEHLGFYTAYPYGTPRYWYVKSLSGLNEAQLVSSFGKDAQYFLKKAKKYGIRVRSLAYEELDKFKALTEAAAEHHDFVDKDLAYYQLFYRTFSEKADFLVAELDFGAYKDSLNQQIAKLEAQISQSQSSKKAKQRQEYAEQIASHKKRLEEAETLSEGKSGTQILSGGLFIYGQRETVYLFSGTLERYRRLYAPYLIQEEIMRRTLARGVTRYNFWGVAGLFDGSDGVLHFKASFAGLVEEKVGRFILPAKPLKYGFTKILKKVLRR